MKFKKYTEQLQLWPIEGRHILAQYDENSIYVYQAYNEKIALYAVENQKFGGEFSFNRMSWIKPNFLWMMYRSGWATKTGQERILAIRLPRNVFDSIVHQAIESTFDTQRFESREAWSEAIAHSDVRLQWDPDHDPSGNSVSRRAMQLGLKGAMLRHYSDHLISIEDITPFVCEQRAHIVNHSELLTPEEEVYRLPSCNRKSFNKQ